MAEEPTAAANGLASVVPPLGASTVASPFFAAISRSALSISSRPSSAAGVGLAFALPLDAAGVDGALGVGASGSIAGAAAPDFFFFRRFFD